MYLVTISSVPSVEPSLTITHLSGRTVCVTTDSIVSSMNCASFRAGVIKTSRGKCAMSISLIELSYTGMLFDSEPGPMGL